MTKKSKYFIGVDPFDEYKPKNIEKLFAPELLPKPSWSDAEIAMKWAMYAQKAEEVKLKPHFSLIEHPDLPNGVFYALSHNGAIERVTLQWDDVEKKNHVIVKKYGNKESKRNQRPPHGDSTEDI